MQLCVYRSYSRIRTRTALHAGLGSGYSKEPWATLGAVGVVNREQPLHILMRHVFSCVSAAV